MFVFGAANVQAQFLKKTEDKLNDMVLAVELTGPQMLSLEMKQELNLTEEQLAQIELLNEQHYRHMEEVEAAMVDPLQRQRKYRDINLQLDKALTGILNEQQLKHFLELEGRQYVRYLSGAEDE